MPNTARFKVLLSHRLLALYLIYYVVMFTGGHCIFAPLACRHTPRPFLAGPLPDPFQLETAAAPGACIFVAAGACCYLSARLGPSPIARACLERPPCSSSTWLQGNVPTLAWNGYGWDCIGTPQIARTCHAGSHGMHGIVWDSTGSHGITWDQMGSHGIK
jgi:hypothetical protein